MMTITMPRSDAALTADSSMAKNRIAVTISASFGSPPGSTASRTGDPTISTTSMASSTVNRYGARGSSGMHALLR
ncbi:MAG: hypothetical protein ACYSUA_19345 [Planctomycetota bacterium]